MVPPTRVVRIKKLSKSQGQQIVRQDQIDDYDSLQSQSSYDTGVEKGEEKVNIAPKIPPLWPITRDNHVFVIYVTWIELTGNRNTISKPL